MATVAAQPARRSWAFWSPASDELISAALDLAGLRPGEEFLDIGCGDGRVLVAAAKRGARVRGIELNPELAAISRRALNEAGADGRVECVDMLEADLSADVVYTYLTQVMLSRLAGRLEQGPAGTRVVSPSFRYLEWQESATAGDCFRYDLPAAAAPEPESLGWPARGMLIVAPPMRRCLVSLTFGASAGELELRHSASLARAMRTRVGHAFATGRKTVAVDVQFEPCPGGGAAAGQLTLQRHELAIAVVFGEQGQGRWAFGPEQGETYRAALANARRAALDQRVGAVQQ